MAGTCLRCPAPCCRLVLRASLARSPCDVAPTLQPSWPMLQEATGLSALFQRVDDLFAAGDPARLADALAGMRRGLAVVGDSVAEFRGG